MNNPLISIILPLYNAEEFIEFTIKSITEQSYNNWELIIVDDCSKDNSILVVENFLNKNYNIKLITSNKNFGGPAKPRNLGIEKAQGEYIAFIDSDDIWHKNKLEEQIKWMIKKDVNFSSTSFDLIDKNNGKIGKSLPRKLFKLFFRRKSLCSFIISSYIATSSVIVKKDLLEYFSEDKDAISVEDFLLWIQLLDKEEVSYKLLDKELFSYRVLNNSISNREFNHFKQYLKADLVLIKYILNNNRFDLLKCFYLKVIKDFIITLKNI